MLKAIGGGGDVSDMTVYVYVHYYNTAHVTEQKIDS